MDKTPPAKFVTGRILGNAVEPIDDPTASVPAAPHASVVEEVKALYDPLQRWFRDHGDWSIQHLYDKALDLARRLEAWQKHADLHGFELGQVAGVWHVFQKDSFGAMCATCGFQYQEYKGHIIPCPRCVAEAAEKELKELREKL